MAKFKEEQIIQCPSEKSFNSHLLIWEEVERIVEPMGCQFTWEVLSKKERTFKLDINAPSKEIQMNAFIKVMNMLNAKGIEPAIFVDTNDLKYTEAEKIVEEMKEVLHA